MIRLRSAFSFLAGFLTGLAVYQGPDVSRAAARRAARLLHDQPATPPGHRPRYRYWNGGVEVTAPDTQWPLAYRTANPANPVPEPDPTVKETP
ncbi:hypothetical protein [Microbacterium sp.]|uniref:hypothetical protein n=1 Tax=Microbacterium sp. TaxID=51671 RepID=UPI0039E52C88